MSDTVELPGIEDLSKAKSRSVSMPESIWRILEEYASSLGSDRSEFLRKLAIGELRRAGKLPGTTENALLAEFLELMASSGEKEARDLLHEWAGKLALKQVEKP